MGPIQGGINQSLTILGALATQSPELQRRAENRQLNKDYKNLGEQADKLLNERPLHYELNTPYEEEEYLNKENIRFRDIEDIADKRKDIAIKLGKSEDYENNLKLKSGAITGQKNIQKRLKEVNIAIEELNFKVQSKLAQKDRITEMKKTVKSIKEENLRNDLYKKRDIKTDKEDN